MTLVLTQEDQERAHAVLMAAKVLWKLGARVLDLEECPECQNPCLSEHFEENMWYCAYCSALWGYEDGEKVVQS